MYIPSLGAVKRYYVSFRDSIISVIYFINTALSDAVGVDIDAIFDRFPICVRYLPTHRGDLVGVIAGSGALHLR